jgi:replicative DNA helicase
MSDWNVEKIDNLRDLLIARFKADKRSIRGFPTTRWDAFNNAFGGFRPGEVVTITAETGMGKTSFVLNWLMDTVQQDIPSMLVSLEERWSATAERLAVMTGGKPMTEWEPSDLGGIVEVWKGVPMYYLDHHGRVEQHKAFGAIRESVEKYAVKFVVVDHMDYLRRTPKQGESEAALIGGFMQDLAGLAHELDVCVVLVAHPKKTEVKGVEKRREIGMDELKGSSSIKQESDAVFSVFQPDPSSTEMWLRFQKIRSIHYSQNNNGVVRFQFNPNNLWFSELSLAVEWDPKEGV